jgi:hypothetical protein
MHPMHPRQPAPRRPKFDPSAARVLRAAFVLAAAGAARLALAGAAPPVDLGAAPACVVGDRAPGNGRDQLVRAKTALMDADYRADFAALARWRDAVAPLESDAEWGYLAHYWAGFASWRAAINGGSLGMSAVELRSHLERAVADFEASIARRGDFADALAASALASSWLIGFRRDEPEAMRELLDRYAVRRARALELAPNNPRVLWLEGAHFLFRPASMGGDLTRALDTYARMSAAADRDGRNGESDAASPLPDWGKPEALMSLAYTALQKGTAADLDRAETWAREALALRPDWAYVQNTLMPQIAKAREAEKARDSQ